MIFPLCRFTQGKLRSQAVRMLRRMSSLTGWEKDNFTVLRCRCITDLTLEMEKMQMQCFFIRSHGHQGGWCNIWKLYFQSVWNIAPEISILKTAFHSVYHNLDTFVPGGPSVFGKSTVQIIISSPLHYWWWYCSWKSEDVNKETFCSGLAASKLPREGQPRTRKNS